MTEDKTGSEEKQRKTEVGMSIGMVCGALFGFALWMLTDTFIWLPVFIGCGLSVGMAIGSAAGEKKQG